MNSPAAMNGSAPAQNQPQIMQVNPMQAASFAVNFLDRCTIRGEEVEAFQVARGLLQAIATGQVVLAPPATEHVAPTADPKPVKGPANPPGAGKK